MTVLKPATPEAHGIFLDKMMTSYHEAGHTIVMILNLIPFSYVVVEKGFGAGGITDFDDVDLLNYNSQKLKTDISIRLIQVYYAGFLAEKQFLYNTTGITRYPINMKYGFQLDNKYARDHLKKLNSTINGRKSLKKELSKITSRIISEYWSDVEMIAKELFVTPKLSSKKVFKLLTLKSKNKTFWSDQITKLYNCRDCFIKNDEAALTAALTL